MNVTLKIKRFDPDEDDIAFWETFDVECDEMDRVLDLLNSVKWDQDGTLTYRRSCAHGVCGSDAMVINGSNALACKLLVRDAGNPIIVEPIRGLPVIKDLIVDMEPFFDSYKSVLPYLINDEPAPDRERIQTPEQHDKFEDTTKCILCAACTTSCPIFWTNDEYVGPAAVVNAHRFIFDSRDDAGAERMAVLAEKNGAFRCRTAFNCTEACPRDIKVTQAIEEVKRAILFKKI